MDVRIIVETTAETGEKRIQELQCLSLPGHCYDDLGLKLKHGKALLARLQRAILDHQIKATCDASRNCPCCGRVRPVHDYRTQVSIRSLDGSRLKSRGVASVRVALVKVARSNQVRRSSVIARHRS